MTRPRRGVALITALWLVVGIAVVVLQFSIEAKERRLLGIAAAERGVGRAAATGALALLQARIDYALRARSTDGNNVAILRSSDPLLDVDSLYSGTYQIDSVRVDVKAVDLGTVLNINTLTEAEFKTFFGFALNDYTLADRIAQSIMDWRDQDDIPRASGAERDDYIRAGLLVLPTNSLFREVEDLALVKGITPAIFATVRPYLTTRGGSVINLNTAPAPVLRVLPGMSDAILAQILSLRAQGRRITSVQQVMSSLTAQRPGMARNPAQAEATARATQQLASRASVESNQVEFFFTARTAPQAHPVRLLAVLARAGNGAQRNTSISWKEW